MTLSIDATGREIIVTDTVEQRRCELYTPDEADITPVDGDEFYFPVDGAVAVEAQEVTLFNYVATFVRTGDGDQLAQIDTDDEQTFPPGTYIVEVSESVKLYFRVDGAMRIETGDVQTTISTPDGSIAIGGRSHHNKPAGTITTTGDPADLVRAVSALSSSLKTTTPERSFPTLRGHPPEIVVGDELSIPDRFDPARSDVHIEVPARREYIYPAAPLAFYLGVPLELGENPRIVGEDGYSHALDGVDGYEAEVERVLKQTFLLDCVVRTEGYYTIDLHEREALEDDLPFEPGAVYDESLTERLRTYLDVPYEVIEGQVPDWKATAYIEPTPENAEYLPFLLDQLATVRMPDGEEITAEEATSQALREFATAGNGSTATRTAQGPTRSESRNANVPAQPDQSFIRPAATDSVETIWAAPDVPIGATKASVRAYRNGLESEPSEEIGVTVVCNEPEMLEEGEDAEEIYGDDADFPFDLRYYENLSTAALRAVLETDREFLHYIGHINANGFKCRDGRLDARTVEEVGVDAFFLNACSSYEQGMELIDGGSVGGIVTLSEVINSGAIRVGKSMIRLLDAGLPLRPALNLSREASFVGGQYIVIGKGDVDLIQRETLLASILEITTNDDGYDLTYEQYLTKNAGLGAFTKLYVESNGTYYLASGRIGPFEVSKEELQDVLFKFNMPARYDGQLKLSSDISL